jgi:hypothetical protein
MRMNCFAQTKVSICPMASTTIVCALLRRFSPSKGIMENEIIAAPGMGEPRGKLIVERKPMRAS